MARGGSIVACLSLVLVATFAWFWPTLAHGFRSDDFLIGYYADGQGGGAFSRAFAEFGRGWFGVRDLWRPLVSVSLAIDFELGSDAWGFRATNVALVGIAAFATACTAARLSPRRPVLAGAVAAMLVVLHPAAVEPVAWISARTTGLEVAMGALATAAFVRRLDGIGSPFGAPLLLALALASKEGAVAVPCLWFAIALGRAPTGARVSALRHLVPAGIVVLGYFVLRKLVLDVFATAEAGHGIAERFNVLAVRSATWIAPPTPDGDGAWTALAAFLVACSVAARDVRRLASAVAIAGLLLLAPTSHSFEPIGTMTGRLVFPAVPALAIAVALVVATASSRAARAMVITAAIAMVSSYATWSGRWITRYGEDDGVIAAVRAGLSEATANAAPGRPMAISMLPGLPLLQTHLWCMLGVPPFAPRELALVGLGEMLQRDPDSPGLYGDAAMAHAFAELGAGTLAWDPALRRFVALPRPQSSEVELAHSDGGVFAAPVALPATAYATVEIMPSAPCRRIALELIDDLQGQWAFGRVEQEFEAGLQRATFDLTHSVAVLLRAGSGAAFRGLRVSVDGRPAGLSVRVVARATVVGESSAVPFSGKELTVEQFVAALQPPRADLPLRLYLGVVGRTMSCDVHRGGALKMSIVEQRRLELARDLMPHGSVHWFWQTPPSHRGTPWRSPIDWVRLR
jgi:hypothetical protein